MLSQPPPPSAEFSPVPATYGLQLTPLGGVANVVRILVILTMTLTAIDIPLEIYFISKFDRNLTRWDISEFTSTMYEVSGLLALLIVVVFLAAGISTMVMMKRMAANGEQIAPREATHKSHWAVTGWFVPFLNLVRPYAMVKQIWHTNRSKVPGFDTGPPPAVFAIWWGLNIATTVIARVLPSPGFGEEWTMDDLANDAIGSLVMDVFIIATGIAFLMVVRVLAERHHQAFDQPWEHGQQVGASRTPTEPPTLAPPPPVPTAPWSRVG